MKVIYSQDVLKHSAQGEIKQGGLIPARESPTRVEQIKRTLELHSSFEFVAPDDAGLNPILKAHDRDYITFLKTVWSRWTETMGLADDQCPDALPLILPVESLNAYSPETVEGLIGRYALDVGTPITADMWSSTYAAAQCALTGARYVTDRSGAVFALTRPPGHHAARDKFGGYCFLNHAAIAARSFQSDHGVEKVAILDLDYHHGNGTQAIFYEDPDVLVVNIHADPAFEYPYFLGRAEETGSGPGEGTTLNLPLPRGTGWRDYKIALTAALNAIRSYGAEALIVSWGFDTYKGDPLSTFQIETTDFARMGEAVCTLGIPTLVLLEGGYATDQLGENVHSGLAAFT